MVVEVRHRGGVFSDFFDVVRWFWKGGRIWDWWWFYRLVLDGLRTEVIKDVTMNSAIFLRGSSR